MPSCAGISALRRAGLPLVAIEAAQAIAADRRTDEARLWIVRQLLARREALRDAFSRIDDMVAELTVRPPGRSNREDS